MNPAAVLLAHITGVLREGIDLALANPPTRVRAQEFQTRGGGGAELLRRLDSAIDLARLRQIVQAQAGQGGARVDEDGMITRASPLSPLSPLSPGGVLEAGPSSHFDRDLHCRTSTAMRTCSP